MRKQGSRFPSFWDVVFEQTIANRFPEWGKLLKEQRESALASVPDCREIYRAQLLLGMSLIAKEQVDNLTTPPRT